ncbi:MAG TPA: hypothetical protein ENK59_09285 [Thioploca sp.]|nr:hypothetical protein [Thioploca sp.]
MKNKRGTTTVYLLLLVLASFFGAIFLGLAVFSFNTVNSVLSQNINIGQVNLKNATDTTFGAITHGFVGNADLIGIILLMGMCLLIIMMGYYFGSSSPKMFFIVDVFLIVIFFIPAVYVSQTYLLFINSTTLLQGTYTNILSKTSKFVLHLPSIMTTVGVLTMILSYVGIRKDDKINNEVSVLGY